MNTLPTQFGWLFVLIAAIFALGLVPQFAHRFYPLSPGFVVRLAAPVIFALLAMAFFEGIGTQALVAVIVLSLTQIVFSRWRGKRHDGFYQRIN